MWLVNIVNQTWMEWSFHSGCSGRIIFNSVWNGMPSAFWPKYKGHSIPNGMEWAQALYSNWIGHSNPSSFECHSFDNLKKYASSIRYRQKQKGQGYQVSQSEYEWDRNKSENIANYTLEIEVKLVASSLTINNTVCHNNDFIQTACMHPVHCCQDWWCAAGMQLWSNFNLVTKNAAGIQTLNKIQNTYTW